MAFLQRVFKTWIEVIFTPKKFFSKLSPEQGYKEPLLFATALFCITALINLIIMLLQGDANLSECFIMVANIISIGMLGLFIESLLFHLIVLIMDKTKKFKATFKVISYSNAAVLLGLLPIIGRFLIFYFVILFYFGFRGVHNLTKRQAIEVIIAPIILIAIIGLFAAILIPNITR